MTEAALLDGALLVSDDIAPDGEHYQRPLGGRVEVGERATDTVGAGAW